MVLRTEVAWAREVNAAAGAARTAAMLSTETSTREAAMVWDSANLHIKGVEDRVDLAEQEALERVSQAEVENSATLFSARVNTEDLARKVILLEDELVEERRAWETSEREHRERFEELTLL
jgi:hypothetical protein